MHAVKGVGTAKSVYDFIRAHGDPGTWTREDLLAALGQDPTALPLELEGGPKNHTVYLVRTSDHRVAMIGLTNDLEARQAWLGPNVRVEPVSGPDGLSRGQALAVLEASTLRRDFHAIDPEADFYGQAQRWGRRYLAELGSDADGGRGA